MTEVWFHIDPQFRLSFQAKARELGGVLRLNSGYNATFNKLTLIWDFTDTNNGLLFYEWGCQQQPQEDKE